MNICQKIISVMKKANIMKHKGLYLINIFTKFNKGDDYFSFYQSYNDKSLIQTWGLILHTQQ